MAVARAAGLLTSRIDGSPLGYNQRDALLPDLVVCRPQFADAVLAVTGRLPVRSAPWPTPPCASWPICRYEPASLAESTLILIDCQNTYTRGVMELEGVQAALDEAAALLDRAPLGGHPDHPHPARRRSRLAL